MKIKTIAVSALSLCITLVNPVLANDDVTLLKSFHDYGITKCDSFIVENSTLEKNWNYFIVFTNRCGF